jgi:hypothetical protein
MYLAPQDTLGSVGVILSTVMIEYTGWTVFDPIASLFIAALIVASVVPLVIDSARVLMLELGEEKEVELRHALAEVRFLSACMSSEGPLTLAKLPVSSTPWRDSSSTPHLGSGQRARDPSSARYIYGCRLSRPLKTLRDLLRRVHGRSRSKAGWRTPMQTRSLPRWKPCSRAEYEACAI